MSMAVHSEANKNEKNEIYKSKQSFEIMPLEPYYDLHGCYGVFFGIFSSSITRHQQQQTFHQSYTSNQSVFKIKAIV